MSQPLQKKTAEETEFGDFQTPPGLAAEVCGLLARLKLLPLSIVEPTCGKGNLLIQALDQFPDAQRAIAQDISPLYIATVRARLEKKSYSEKVHVQQGDFFHTDWPCIIGQLPEPVLIVGNPPWITNSQMGTLGGANLPQKNNFQKHSGLGAKTGKSNFDISEWMMLEAIECLNGRNGVLAVLCKTAVARKLLVHAWKNHLSISHAAMYRIDAAKHFSAMVDACLFVCSFTPHACHHDCQIFSRFAALSPEQVIGYRDQNLVSKVDLYEQRKHLNGNELYKWRSGIKHDCAKVMELTRENDTYRNGFGEIVEMEDNYLYPMLKTSEVAKPDVTPTRYMLLPQTFIGEDTRSIADLAPQTWHYLEKYGDLLDRRGSSIYRERPRFSVFGIGAYSFAPWKVAISGFYKRLSFKVVGPAHGKPVVLDDASYFVACQSAEEAVLIAYLLNSQLAREFFEAYVFWDAKRPITIDLLRRLDLSAVAHELGVTARLQPFIFANAVEKERNDLARIRRQNTSLLEVY